MENNIEESQNIFYSEIEHPHNKELGKERILQSIDKLKESIKKADSSVIIYSIIKDTISQTGTISTGTGINVMTGLLNIANHSNIALSDFMENLKKLKNSEVK